MKATLSLSYYLLLGLTYMQAVLPLWMVRLQSRILAGLLHTVVRYRRKVVRDNLTRCFPEKSLQEIRRIERRFYYNFTYQILSSFKLLTYSQTQLRRHISFENLDVLIRLRAEGHPAILLMMGHFGNWEYFSGSQAIIKDLGLQIYQIFRPLKSTSSDRLMHRIRERFGSRGIAKQTCHVNCSDSFAILFRQRLHWSSSSPTKVRPMPAHTGLPSSAEKRLSSMGRRSSAISSLCR